MGMRTPSATRVGVVSFESVATKVWARAAIEPEAAIKRRTTPNFGQRAGCKEFAICGRLRKVVRRDKESCTIPRQ